MTATTSAATDAHPIAYSSNQAGTAMKDLKTPLTPAPPSVGMVFVLVQKSVMTATIKPMTAAPTPA